MNTNDKMTELRNLQKKADAIRRELGISPPGKVTFLAPLAAGSDDDLIVQADGFGGATLSVVEGNYPVDYFTKFEKNFSTEKDAETAAEEAASKGIASSYPSTSKGRPLI